MLNLCQDTCQLTLRPAQTRAFQKTITILCLSMYILTALSATAAPSFYTRPPVFSTRPSDQSKYMQPIDRFGPVGIGIELHPPAFIMKVKHVEPGSPAAKSGELKAGQIIESINGQKLHDIDPRIQLGNIITDSEATDGKVTFLIKDDEKAPLRKVVVTIPVLGAYSPTWPLDCPKSDRIVRELADHLAATDWSGKIDLNGPKMLFLLSTGEEKDLEVVKRWAKKSIAANQNFGDSGHAYQWFVSWGGPCLAEYYLRTGDEEVLPVLKKIADAVRKTMYHDGWGGRGLAGHHMGLAGTGTLTFLLLARQCGVEVEENMLQRALIHYFRFAGRGINPYMDARPEGGFTDNGRNARLALAMSAASALVPNGETSVYARARDISAFRSFYSTSYMLHGHTGGGIGEVWRSAAMGLLYEKKPDHYREFMTSRTWWYDLSRRYDGSFGILGGGKGYDKESWGMAIGLTYTAPRKKLCIFGAPRSQYAKDYNIPTRPWGNIADDAFYSLDPAKDENGKIADLSGEKMAADSALAIHRRMGQPPVSDASILYYARHPEQGLREAAAGAIDKYQRFNLLPQLLRDKDPRVRQTGLMAIKLPHRRGHGGLDAGISEEHFTKDIRSILFDMINDPEESWYVVDRALAAVSMAPAEEIAPHIDRLGYWLSQDEWWHRESALKALIVVAADKRYYKKVLPILAKNLPDTIRAGTIHSLVAYADPFKKADPEVQQALCDMLSQVYLEYPGKNANPPGGLHPVISERGMLNTIAGALANIPGGKEKLFEIARQRSPGSSLPHQNIFLAESDLSAYDGEMKTALQALIENQLIPAYIGSNWKYLKAFAASEPKSSWRQMDGLSALYTRAGITDYNWQVHGPRRNEMEWYYTSFNPPEKWIKADDRMGRYREVTFPEGTENWYALDFDPAKAGWQKGLAPFGSADGEKRHPAQGKNTHGCNMAFCGCGEAINTLWEKDVLLLKGTFTFPKLEEGNCYRLLHGGISHVGSGGGYRVYVNGKLFIETKTGVDRRAGGVPIGRTITKDWWPEFNNGPVDIAVISLMKTHPRTKAYGGNIMISMEQMKTPPLTDDTLAQSAKVIPMLSAEWQAMQDPEKTNVDPDEGKFRYDGAFTANPDILGSWTPVDQVPTIDAFVPGERQADRFRPPFSLITFKDNGRTDDVSRIWSADMLMDLKKYQALKMTLKPIAGITYLFIEAGGFSNRHPGGWETPLIVLKRK